MSVEVADALRSRDGVITAVGGIASLEEWGLIGSEGHVHRVLAVKVKNSGRGPTSVVSVGLLFHHGGSWSTPQIDDPPLPFRLEGESEQTWYYEATLI